MPSSNRSLARTGSTAAYGWAFAKPVRKVTYNITITSISVAVAVIIGTIELVGVLADEAHVTSGPISVIANINLDYAGYGIVVLFFVSWLIAQARGATVVSNRSGPLTLRRGRPPTTNVPASGCAPLVGGHHIRCARWVVEAPR